MSKLYSLLGKTGDLLSILPFLEAEFKSTGIKPRLMVAAEFAGVLDGVTYIEPVIHQGPFYEIEKAVTLAKTNGDEVVSLQVAGPRADIAKHTYEEAGQTSARTTSYQKEAWKLAGKLALWDECLPLNFDNRSAEREAALVEKYLPRRPGRKKKLMLVALGGNSSPFKYAKLLMFTLHLAFDKEYQILEVPKADRIYDLLALYERASVLIAADSAPLHLAWACRQLPVFALTNDQPTLWNGSPWRPNHHWYCRYSDFPDRAVEMVKEIEKLPEFIYDPEYIHVWSEYEVGRTLPSFRMPLPIKRGMCGWDSKLALNDVKQVPYLKYVIRMAIQKCHSDKTVIILTRPDTIFSMRSILVISPSFAYRLTQSSDSLKFAPIVDEFYARCSFWKSILDQIPDVLLCGDAVWSEALRIVFQKNGAIDATGLCERAETPPKVGFESKTGEHNRNMLASLGHLARYPKVTDQLETLPLQGTQHMFKFGYNPTVLKTPTGFSMVYRYHDAGANTGLARAEFDTIGNFEKGGNLMFDNEKSFDDAKFFKRGEDIYLSWVESNFPKDLKAVVKYAPIRGGLDLSGVVQPPFAGNDWTTTQKNYVFWYDNNETLFCLSQCDPTQKIYEATKEGWKLHETDAPIYPYGAIRGGTPPVEYDGNLLRFFHSSLRNEYFSSVRHRYYVGCYITENKPPFRVLRVSKKPILYGSELDDLTPEQVQQCFHRKQNVVFCNGVMEAKDSWILASGVNDSACVLSIVKERDLNL